MPSVGPKASQWSFTVPSFNKKTIDRLSSLLPTTDLVAYITFAVLDDDNGNNYILGLITTTHPCRVGPLVKLMGDAIFSTVKHSHASNILIEIHMEESFQEFGKQPLSLEKYTREIALLKETVSNGTYSINKLMKTHPLICTRNIRLVLKHLYNVLSKAEADGTLH